MAEKLSPLELVTIFRRRNKFEDAAWLNRGLNPSSPELSRKLEKLFNACADDLIAAINEGRAKTVLLKIMEKHLSGFKALLDTEEKEFVGDLFMELARIVVVDFTVQINSWFYGIELHKMPFEFKHPPPLHILETISQPCQGCHLPLETFIIKKDKGIPDLAWYIVQCNSCYEFSLIDLGPGIKELRYGNYQVVQELPRQQFSKDQVIAVIDKLRLTKKN